LLVGKDVVDIDHEQLRLDEIDATDDISLEDPRPDTSQSESREQWAWNPVGGGITHMGSRTVGLGIDMAAGKVTVAN
jgi:hypothetical protein